MIETAFTPFQSLGGGALIGVASVLLMATMGRIMGATGILAGVLQPANLSDWLWRGVTYGAGCASGHGVCGMARLSPRSFIATVTFMLTTGITVYVIRHVLGA